ncbi:MAG TPA: D-glycero-beta-D-manno-heptose 1-phosphate adenylyltransferase [Bryobacterales bacterium]|nr:D-glycero-beta-D-manno-heptose 1-phosphate adenylyltransferase [Bryobacterales bacterium]
MGLVLDRPALLARRREWREAGQKVVFTNGCYDLLHPGHVRLLERARGLGDRLVVAINSDASVRRLKGPQRPILPEDDRAALVASLAAVDAVTLFDEDTPCELLTALLPDVLVKGADWSHWIAGREIVEAAGGAVLALPLEPDFSTTDIVETVLELPT